MFCHSTNPDFSRRGKSEEKQAQINENRDELEQLRSLAQQQFRKIEV
jgi:hypothetical protein